MACAAMALSCSSPPGAPGGLPLAPSPPVSGARITDLRVECQSPVFVGELPVCAAVYRRLGVPSNVSVTAAWSSMMPLQGNYFVASASRAGLSLLISNQDGRAVAVGNQRFVTGGDRFILSLRFTVPPDTTRLCRAAVLMIGELRLSEPPPGRSIISCLPVMPS